MMNGTALPYGMSDADGRRVTWRGHLFLVLLCLALFMPGLFTMPPIDRDEARFAQATKQMIETGNYIDIHFQQEARNKKPIGIYWLQAASVKIFGGDAVKDQIWPYRLPSVLGTIIAVMLTAAAGARFRNAKTGLLAGAMLAGCLLLQFDARLGKTDAALMACVVAAQYALGRCYLGLPQSARFINGNTLLFWIALGTGMLLKGPIILLVVGLTILTLVILERRAAWLLDLQPVKGLAIVALIVAPWLIAITLSTKGVFFREAVGHDLFGKILESQGGWKPPGFHLIAFPALFWPFSLFAVLAIPDIWKNRRAPFFRFLLAWIVPTWIVFELIPTKLPHYVLPTYPAIALLTATILLQGFPAITTRLTRFFRRATIVMWFLIGIGLATILAALSDLMAHETLPGGQIAAGIALLVAMTSAVYLMSRAKHEQSALTLLIGSLIFYYAVFCSTLPGLRNVWISREAVAAFDMFRPCLDARLVTAGYNEPSIVFMAGTQTYLANSGEAAAHALTDDICALAMVEEERQAEFRQTLHQFGMAAFAITDIRGFNYSSGGRKYYKLFRALPLPPSHPSPPAQTP